MSAAEHRRIKLIREAGLPTSTTHAAHLAGIVGVRVDRTAELQQLLAGRRWLDMPADSPADAAALLLATDDAWRFAAALHRGRDVLLPISGSFATALARLVKQRVRALTTLSLHSNAWAAIETAWSLADVIEAHTSPRAHQWGWELRVEVLALACHVAAAAPDTNVIGSIVTALPEPTWRMPESAVAADLLKQLDVDCERLTMRDLDTFDQPESRGIEFSSSWLDYFPEELAAALRRSSLGDNGRSLDDDLSRFSVRSLAETVAYLKLACTAVSGCSDRSPDSVNAIYRRNLVRAGFTEVFPPGGPSRFYKSTSSLGSIVLDGHLIVPQR